MLIYTLVGAVIGTVVGHLIPPGYFFWFVIGVISVLSPQNTLEHAFKDGNVCFFLLICYMIKYIVKKRWFLFGYF